MTTAADVLAQARQALQSGAFALAESMLRQVLAVEPRWAIAWYLFGTALAEQGRLPDAVQCFQQAIVLEPQLFQAYGNLGTALLDLGQLWAAEACLRHALELQPDNPLVHNSLGGVLVEQRRLDEALASYREAVRLAPDYAEAHANLAETLAELGLVDDAAREFRAAVALRPSSLLRYHEATILPVIYDSVEEIHARRGALQRNVRRLADEGIRIDASREQVAGVFYLPYQGYDDLALQRELSRLVVVSDQDSDAFRRLSSAKPSRDKIHLGFISKHFRQHTIGELMRGIVKNLSRDRFHVTLLSVGCYGDPVADAIRQAADRYIELPTHIAAARQLVAELQLDILFYPELGMDWLSHTLAFSRLAPVQCVTWGHPVTSGIDTIDYFISSELFETAEADSHYSERLIRLSHLPAYCLRPSRSSPLKDRHAFGFSAEDHMYACPQSLFKLHPEFDPLLSAILERDPQGQVVLVESVMPTWNEQIKGRLARTLPQVVDRVRWLPWMSHDDFLSLCAVSDVLLDPLHFNGGNTSLKALAFGTPVVTLPGPFLRSRLTYAFYKQMGVFDAVASSSEDYVALAVGLASDQGFQQLVRTRILASNGILYENQAAVRELETFFQQAITAQTKN